MNKFQSFCYNSLKIFIGIALILILISGFEKINFGVNSDFDFMLLFLIGIFGIGGFIIINLNINTKLKMCFLLIIALLLRLWWIFNVNSVPVSDFNTMYLAAKELLKGNYEIFRDFGYLARFPHLVCTSLYMALMIIIFPVSHLFAIKIVNIVLSVISLILLYKLSDYFLRHEKVKLGIILLGALFPAFIAYSSTYCTENIAIPLFLGTLLLFMDAQKTNDIGKWILCGIVLSLSNLFRAVGIVFLIAFIIFIFVFTNEKKFRNVTVLTFSMIITSATVSLFLISVGVIQRPLWSGSEPSFATLMLKGTNVENGGRWNLEDAQFVDANLGNKDLAKMCIEKATHRISKLSVKEKILFFGQKFISQWSVGDFSGTYWAFLDSGTELKYVLPPVFQVIFIITIFLGFLSLLSKEKLKNSAILYILLCGFGIVFMILETQSRYSYICSWIFVILAVSGIEYIIKLSGRVKNAKFFSRNSKRT